MVACVFDTRRKCACIPTAHHFARLHLDDLFGAEVASHRIATDTLCIFILTHSGDRASEFLSDPICWLQLNVDWMRERKSDVRPACRRYEIRPLRVYVTPLSSARQSRSFEETHRSYVHVARKSAATPAIKRVGSRVEAIWHLACLHSRRFRSSVRPVRDPGTRILLIDCEDGFHWLEMRYVTFLLSVQVIFEKTIIR